MEGKQKLEVKLQLDKFSFYIDETITGFLSLQTERPSIIEKIVVDITLFQKYELNCNSKGASTINLEKICSFELDLNSSLSKVEGCYILKGGNTKIPIKIELKKDLYPSFEFPLIDKYAFLRYKFDINVFSMSFDKTYFSFYLRLLSRPNTDNKNKNLCKSITKSLKKWNIFNIGSTTLTVSIPENNFKYDDTNFKIVIFVDNINGKETTKELKVKLMRTIEFYNKDNIISFKEDLAIASKDIPAVVQPGEKQYFDCVLPLKESDTSRYIYNDKNPIPYDFFLSDINYYMPTIFSRCITCKYELIVSLNFNCFVYENSLPKISFPIYMTNQSPFEYLFDIEKKEADKKDKVFVNNVSRYITLNNQSNNNEQLTNDNSGGIINQIDAPSPFNFQKNIDIDVNIFEQNKHNININNKNININNNQSKSFTNNVESININSGNNIKYNFNISINNNLDSNINNNINNNANNNIINNNLNDNNIIEEDNNIIEEENGNINENKNIKESTFNLL